MKSSFGVNVSVIDLFVPYDCLATPPDDPRVQVCELQAELDDSVVKKNLESVQRQVELLEEEKKDMQGRLEQMEKDNQQLQMQSMYKHTQANRGGQFFFWYFVCVVAYVDTMLYVLSCLFQLF